MIALVFQAFFFSKIFTFDSALNTFAAFSEECLISLAIAFNQIAIEFNFYFIVLARKHNIFHFIPNFINRINTLSDIFVSWFARFMFRFS